MSSSRDDDEGSDQKSRDFVGISPEEKPNLRAVPMMASASLLREPDLLKLTSSGFGKPESVPFSVKQEWCGATTPSVWDVKCQGLELVPLGFPLERTHREICDDASTVATRISGVLRALSIETEFDCENAKAKCKTTDFVCFRIRLFAGSETGEPVIVEVQRRNGSARSFMCSCRAILDAAEGNELAQPSYPLMQKPIGQMRCLKAISLSLAEPANSMEMVMNMLRSTKRDSNILGLENLCSLTDPLKTAPGVAIEVSRSVVLGDDVREEILALTDRDVFNLDDDGFSHHTEQLRHLALIVCANSLSICSKDGSLADAVSKQKWFSDRLVPSLLDEIKRASFSANNAYHAASCLVSLVSCSEVAKALAVRNGGVASLEEAHTFGTRQHELLALETKLCLTMIKSSHHLYS